LEELGTTEIPRLRIGIGPLPADADPREFVLSRFLPAEIPTVDSVIEKAVSGAIDWLDHGIRFCMDKYNGLRIAPEEVLGRDVRSTSQERSYQDD
jgi:PTH1 family peptidyl-tRNA hydrolase